MRPQRCKLPEPEGDGKNRTSAKNLIKLISGPEVEVRSDISGILGVSRSLIRMSPAVKRSAICEFGGRGARAEG